MAVNSAYTLEEAREFLTLWKDCERSLASGQTKSYRVGTREYTALDLDDIAARIQFFANLVESLSGVVRTSRRVLVVPRDV